MSCHRAILWTLADVRPENLPIAADDKDRRCGQLVAQQVEHPIRFSDLVLRVGQHGKRGSHDCPSALHRGKVVHRQRDDLGSLCLELAVIVLQLDELRAVRPSAAALEKDEHYWSVGQLL